MNLKNLKILRDYVAKNKHALTCNMAWYQKVNGVGIDVPIDARTEIYPCLTSCCFLGCAPLAGFPAKGADGWAEYCERVFDLEHGPTWSFLFGAPWPDDFDECIARADMVLSGFDPRTRGWAFDSRYAKNSTQGEKDAE